MNEHAVDHEPDPNDDEPLTPLKILGKAVVDTVFLTLISGFLIFNLAYQIGGQDDHQTAEELLERGVDRGHGQPR